MNTSHSSLPGTDQIQNDQKSLTGHNNHLVLILESDLIPDRDQA